MSDNDHQRLERGLDRLQRRMPAWMARQLARLRRPWMRWVRLPVGILCILAGFLGFLPVLGFWMVPLGVVLLAMDVPLLRRPVGRLMVRAEGWWRRLRRRWGLQP
jgi:hypothetical protein